MTETMKNFIFFEILAKILYIKREMYTCIAIKPKLVLLSLWFSFFGGFDFFPTQKILVDTI